MKWLHVPGVLAISLVTGCGRGKEVMPDSGQPVADAARPDAATDAIGADAMQDAVMQDAPADTPLG